MISTLSVIIPVLNSAEFLPACIASLLPYKDKLQIIAVDGGSLDGSEHILRAHPEILLIKSSPGRARQMNAGAARAHAKAFLFLHSDTFLEGDWFSEIAKLLEDKDTAMGAFKFAIDKKGLSYSLITLGTRFRSYAFNLPYGDQAYFMRSSLFEKLGGFKEQSLMEDMDLVQRAAQHGKIQSLRLRAFTSARAWETDGPWKRSLSNWFIYQQYRMGLRSGDELASAYYHQPTALGVFCKQPTPGKVKTRLGKGIGHEAAAKIYSRLVQHTCKIIKQIPGRLTTYFFFDPPGEKESIQLWLGLEKKLVPQAPGDLGERILKAFEFSQSRGHQMTLLIGTDCPGLNPEIIRKAQTLLEKVDVVLGPASDGGYYLIGAKGPHPELFNDMAWSTNTVLSETLKRIKTMGLTQGLLPTLDDLDTPEDLHIHQKTFGFLRGGSNAPFPLQERP